MSDISTLIYALSGKPLHELSSEELQEFVQTRRQNITAIMEEDVESGGRRTTIGKKSVVKADKLAEMEDNL